MHEEVAIIGMAGRFPGAHDVEGFWRNLADGVESIRPFSQEELAASGVDEVTLANPRFVNAGAVMPDPDRFDASFFGINAREAEIMDPQHRILLEVAWQALEDAGHDPDRFAGRIGVYGGVAPNTYFQNNLATRKDLLDLLGRYAVMLGNEKEYAITRIAYKLNLKGPSISVNTACSSSAVAIHLACQSLLSGECDMALVGGGRILVPLSGGYLYEEGGIMSPDGHCRAFDAGARGTVAGSGIAMIVLRRLGDALQDGDVVHGVIKGTAVNNDGSQKIGFTAPSIQGQAAVIEEALLLADVSPESIGYVEAHGTGTTLGDPIEISALTRAFRKWTQKRQFCPVGSVKSNIGHLDAGAGVAGIIKTIMAMKHGLIPASLNYSAPNPEIDFAGSPFYVNATASEWPDRGGPKRAGVSSFGLGGTNAHIILEEAPPLPKSGNARSHELIVLSAKSEGALSKAARNLAAHLRQHPDQKLADVAFTLQTGRHAFQRRLSVVCESSEQAIGSLEALNQGARASLAEDSISDSVAFMFSGQGSQYVNMGRGLYESESVFRSEMDRCFRILRSSRGLDLKAILYPAEGAEEGATQLLTQTSLTQPALFALEYSLARQWDAWGIRPKALVGHSIGEYVAACLAHVFPPEDALHLVCERGRLMQSLPPGSMLAVPLEEAQIAHYLSDGVGLAVINAPAMCVVSGETEPIGQLANRLSKDGVESRTLHTSHAFHSSMMEPILEPFANAIDGVKLRAPQIPFASNVTGNWITPDQATDPAYWASHIRRTVRFSDCLETLYKGGSKIMVEIGPGRTLTTFARRHPARPATATAVATIRHPKESEADMAFLLQALGRLWQVGLKVDWHLFHADFSRRRLSLPTYPFERQRYWLEPGIASDPAIQARDSTLSIRAMPAGVGHSEPPTPPEASRPGGPRNDAERMLMSIWQGLLGIEDFGIQDNFFELGGTSLLATRMFTQVAGEFGKRLPLATIFEAPTIKQLALLLGQQTTSLSKSSMVKVQPGGSRPPLLCIPGNLGNVYHDLRYLSRHLGPDQPVYGFQDGIGHPSDIGKLAAHFVADIHSSGLRPPYYLTGICSGSVVAFEMAQQLAHQGKEVAFLALVEPASLPLPDARSYFDLLAEIWYRFSRHLGDHSRTVRGLNLGEKVMFMRLRLKLIANLWEMKRYLPQKLPGHMYIFLTQESIDSSPRPRWGDYAAGGAEINQIPGTHRSITGDYTAIEEAHMRVLGTLLRERLDANLKS